MTGKAPIDVALPIDAAIFQIWDALSDTSASEAKLAVDVLMTAMCRLSGAASATWAGAVRVGRREAGDPLGGWRVAAMQAIAPTTRGRRQEKVEPDRPFRTILKEWDLAKVDESFLLPLRHVGEFRIYGFRRDLPAAWFESSFYQAHYAPLGIHDAIFIAFPLNDDCESHFGFYGRTAFSEPAIIRLATTLRGVKWFHRRILLSHGLLVATSPLTRSEGDVLGNLLAGGTEKEIAHRRGLAASTIHQHVLGLYRKFGVGSRAELMSLWLSERP